MTIATANADDTAIAGQPTETSTIETRHLFGEDCVSLLETGVRARIRTFIEDIVVCGHRAVARQRRPTAASEPGWTKSQR